MPERPLRDRVAVVAGATRGAGRGIARMLGAAGATVYCTGRSTRGRPATPGRKETIEETAAMVTAHGGRGVAVRADHTVEAEVESLFSRIRSEAGRLDILVNDIWGGDSLTEWGAPFWELSSAQGFALLERAVHTHILTSRHGAPLMVERDAGLIVEVTDGDTFGYRGNLFYDLAKNAVIRLAYAMAADLRAHRVTALAITPGFLRSEAVLDHFGVAEANWRDAVAKDPYFEESETPLLRGPGDRGAGRGSGRRRAKRTPAVELGAGARVRLHRHRRATPELGRILRREGPGDRRTGRDARGNGPFRRALAVLPGRARRRRNRRSGPAARVVGPPSMRRDRRTSL